MACAGSQGMVPGRRAKLFAYQWGKAGSLFPRHSSPPISSRYFLLVLSRLQLLPNRWGN